MGYFGLATRENKIAWTLIAIFILLGTAFWIPGVLQYRKCLNQYSHCKCKGGRGGGGQCLDPFSEQDRRPLQECASQLKQCRKTPIIIWALGFLFLLGFSWLPCFYFCCCSKDPAYQAAPTSYAQNGVGVQMATGAPYGPNAHYTLHPFATQPYGPMPYYSQQQQQQGCPPPGYSMGYPVGAPQQPPQQPQQQQQQQQQQGAPGNVPVNSY